MEEKQNAEKCVYELFEMVELYIGLLLTRFIDFLELKVYFFAILEQITALMRLLLPQLLPSHTIKGFFISHEGKAYGNMELNIKVVELL